jgi:hypothetical protein
MGDSATSHSGRRQHKSSQAPAPYSRGYEAFQNKGISVVWRGIADLAYLAEFEPTMRWFVWRTLGLSWSHKINLVLRLPTLRALACEVSAISLVRRKAEIAAKYITWAARRPCCYSADQPLGRISCRSFLRGRTTVSQICRHACTAMWKSQSSSFLIRR